VVTCDQKVDVEPPSLSGGEGVELLQEQASLLGLGDRCSPPHDKPAQTVPAPTSEGVSYSAWSYDSQRLKNINYTNASSNTSDTE